MLLIEKKPSVTILELIKYTCMIAGLWFASVTFLLPVFIGVLLFSPLRAKLFAFMYIRMVTKESLVRKLCRSLFCKLDLNDIAPNSKIKLLEIGVADGANFAYYPKNCDVTLLDINPNFADALKETLKSYRNIRIAEFVHGSAEDMKHIESDKFDIVVSTNVFCSIGDTHKALKEVKRVLKPGGRLVFQEHVAFRKHHPVYWIQLFLKPLWWTYMNGCTLDRDTEKCIRQHFPNTSCDRVYLLQELLFLRAHVQGMATKE